MSGRYRQYQDEVWIEVNPRPWGIDGTVYVQMESEDGTSDDDWQEARATFRKREELTAFIDALTFAREAVWIHPEVDAIQSALPGVPTPLDLVRDRQVRQLDQQKKGLEECLETWRGVRKEAADSLYRAALTAIHSTTDAAVRESLQTAALEYDFVMRFGREVA